MPILNPSKISSVMFNYSKKTNTFVTDASVLVGVQFGRVYDDACDEGFTIVSEKTGNEVCFATTKVNRVENDILSWEFKSVTPGTNYSAIIFND